MQFRKGARAALALSLLAGTASVAPSGAQEAIEEIVVMAQRRAQNLQEVPVSVSALGGDQLQESGLSNSLAIGDIVPNLEIKTFGGVPNIFIRGVGNNDFNSSSVGPVSIYRDDVAVASTGSQIFSLFDLDRVEVLRGPQGTLFGKNTTGGAIVYISKLPDGAQEGYFRLGYGRFNLFEAEGAASMPLADGLSARVSGILRRRDGERVNLQTGDRAIDVDEGAVRAILRYHPEGDQDVDIRLAAGTGRDRSDYLQPKPDGQIKGADLFGYKDPAPGDVKILNFNGDSRNYSDNDWVSLTASVGLTDRLSLKSITGYDKGNVDNRVDVDGGPKRIDQIKFLTDTEQKSQELQVAYAGDGVQALIGAFYFDEDFTSHSEADLVGELTFAQGAVPLITDATRRNKSYAIFGQTTINLADDLRLTGGARYTWDKVDATHQGRLIPGFFDATIPDGAPIALVPYAAMGDTFKASSWRLAADYDVTRDVMAYGSVTRGFKSGNFNIGIITSVAERTKVDPEILTAYEVGLKSTLLDRRLRANIAAFYYDYSDLQVLSVNQQGSGVPTLGLDNAADARVKGLEVELTAIPVDGLDLGLNLGLLDAQYRNYTSGAIDPATGRPRDFSGNKLPGAPKFTLSSFAQYSVPLTASYRAAFRAEYNYTAKKYYNNAQDDLVSSRGGHGLLNLRVALSAPDADWELAFWGRNVTDKAYIVDATDLRDFGLIPLYYGERATWGVEFTQRF